MGFCGNLCAFILVMTQSLVLVCDEIAAYEDVAQNFVDALSVERQAKLAAEGTALSLNARDSVRMLALVCGREPDDILAAAQIGGWELPAAEETHFPTSLAAVVAAAQREKNPALPSTYPNWRARFVEGNP